MQVDIRSLSDYFTLNIVCVGILIIYDYLTAYDRMLGLAIL